MIMFCMDDMVPQNHMLRLIDKAIDWDFIYDLVETLLSNRLFFLRTKVHILLFYCIFACHELETM